MSAPPWLLGIPTGNRPASLRRALASYAEHFAAQDRRVAIAVFHSARNAREQQEVQTAVADAGVSARYIGLAEKVALAKEIRRATGVGADVLELALFNPRRHAITTGGNRNAGLLWGAGIHALHADDDTLAVLHAHPESGPFEPGEPPVNDSDACDYFIPADGDMTRFALATTDPRQPRGGLVGALEAAWRAFPAPLAFFGMAGDCGWGAPFGFWGEGLGYLLLPDRALARIAGDARVWRETIGRRSLLHCADRLRASRHAVGMTACFGVDGTAALPPFFPVSRGQDALFSALTERFSGKPSLQLPYAVAHAPLEVRAFHGDELFRSATSLDCARAMFAFLETLPEGADLRGLGRHLAGIGALQAPAFAEALRTAHGQRMRRLLAAARERAKGLATLSSAWRADLEGYCERVESSLVASEPLWVLDAGGNDASESLTRLRELVTGFAAVCEAWPALWSAAQAMKPALAHPTPRKTTAVVPTTTPAPTLCSPYQSWLWRLHRLDPTDTSYILFRAYVGQGALREDALEEAVRVLASRHESLRLRFRGEGGDEPVIEPAPIGEVRLRRLAAMSAHTRAGERPREAQRRLDLRSDLPFELTLVRDSDNATHWELWLRVHHIVWDGVSESIFWRELGHIYANICAGRQPLATLPPLHAGFREIAAQQRRLSATVHSNAEGHWRTALAGLPAELHLSTRPAPQARTAESERLTLPFPAALAESLRKLAQERRTTVAALALAAWQGLLGRYSGQKDITVAVNVANRWSESEEAQIGLFMTVLPTRVDLAGDPSLPALAARNQHALSEGLEHARLPFERLVAAVTQGMGRRRFSVFHALFTHVPKVRAPALGPVELRELDRKVTQSGFELGLTIEDGDTGLAAVLVGNSALFSAADLDRLGNALTSALAGMCATPDAPISSLDWLGADRARLASWNATTAAYPRDQALPSLLRERATRHPKRVALSATDQRLTYGELFQRADALAARLRAAGVHRESRVGVFLDRHPRLIESLLGVWLAGGGYVPLDPGFPKERLAFMLEDAGASVLVTRHALVAELPPFAGTVICVDDIDVTPDAPASAFTDAHALGPESLAYVLYTSGSTGKPKGVEIHHRALVNFLCSMRREPGLSENDVLLALTTVSFDIAALELWLPLLVGARIELGGREEAADGQRLWDMLRRSGATALQTTPATWRALFAAGFPGDQKLKAMIGGEALPPDLGERLASTCGEAWNMYGPTETTVWSSIWRIPRKSTMAVRIGTPIANTVIRVLDDARREVPIGVVGEIYIGGDGVARGYLGRPELTAERFVADPIAGGKARLYRTGDRGRWTPEGELECLGRNDDQIKLRGFRMEPGEIEAALLQLPEVHQAAVALHEATPGDPRLVAWIVLKPATTLPTTQELRARLRTWLLEHMVPYHFIAVEALPLTPNKKIDRRALGKLFRAPPETATSDDKPTADESSIIAEFERQLGRKIGLDSDFFENGGDSLSAVRLLGRIAAASSAAPTTGDLFLHATPRLLAKLVRELGAKHAPRRGHLVPLRQGGALPALVVLHPIGGQLAAYGHLARHLDGHAPVYGLLAAAGEDPRYETITERCAAYVTEIIKDIDRPVALAGYSLGGLLAMECAAQLAARGRDVPLVALFDTWVPRPPLSFARKLAFRAAELRRFSWEERARWVSFQLMRRLGPPEPVLEEELPLIDAVASERLGRQALEWSPPSYAGEVILFRAEVDLRGYSTPPGALGWDKLCPQLSITSLACDHTQMMREPQAESIAARLLDELRRRRRA